MPETPPQGAKKRWLGYTCPDCRMIFRIEAGAQGQRAQCPGCHALMVLGGGGGQQEAPPEMEPKELYSQAVIEDAPKEKATGYLDDGEDHRRRVTLLGPSLSDQVEDLSWERSSTKSEIGNTALTAMLVVMLGFVGAIGYLVYGIVRDDLETGESRPEDVRNLAVKSAEGDLLQGGESDQVAVDLALLGRMAEVRQVVATFLEAPTVDDMLKLVRQQDRLEPLIREYYGENYRPVAVRDIAPEGKVQAEGSMYSVLVELKDFSRLPIAVELVDDRYLVDWESWVGYSEMPWLDFLKTRPQEAKVFRVRCSPVEYYNFDFIDDSKWQSYRLESPDEKFLIFGYAERYSKTAQELSFPFKEQKETAAIVVLRYPDGAKFRNQVLITEFLGTGWIMPDDAE